jgi:hypothetical protein
MAMHATSYDILIGGMVLYPLGITLDFWEEIAHYQLKWQIGNFHKVLLLMNDWGALKKIKPSPWF